MERPPFELPLMVLANDDGNMLNPILMMKTVRELRAKQLATKPFREMRAKHKADIAGYQAELAGYQRPKPYRKPKP